MIELRTERTEGAFGCVEPSVPVTYDIEISCQGCGSPLEHTVEVDTTERVISVAVDTYCDMCVMVQSEYTEDEDD